MMNLPGAMTGWNAVSMHLSAPLAVWNALAWQQDMINSGNSKLLEVFVIVAAVSLFLIMLVVVGIAAVLWKAQKEIQAHVVELKGKLIPLIDKSHGLVTDLTPQIKSITVKVDEITGKVSEIAGKAKEISVHAEQIISVAKDKVNEFSPTISDINAKVKQAVANADVTVQQANETVRTANTKTREQVERVNGMVTSALDATERFGKAVAHGITQPGREIAGMVNGAKSTIDHLVTSSSAGFSGGVSSIVSKVSSLFAKKVYPAAAKPGAWAKPEPLAPRKLSTPRARPVRALPAWACDAGGAVEDGGCREAVWVDGGDSGGWRGVDAWSVFREWNEWGSDSELSLGNSELLQIPCWNLEND